MRNQNIKEEMMKSFIKFGSIFLILLLFAIPSSSLTSPAPYACFYGPPTNGSYVLTTGDSMTGDLNMTGNDIWSVGDMTVTNLYPDVIDVGNQGELLIFRNDTGYYLIDSDGVEIYYQGPGIIPADENQNLGASIAPWDQIYANEFIGGSFSGDGSGLTGISASILDIDDNEWLYFNTANTTGWRYNSSLASMETNVPIYLGVSLNYSSADDTFIINADREILGGGDGTEFDILMPTAGFFRIQPSSASGTDFGGLYLSIEEGFMNYAESATVGNFLALDAQNYFGGANARLNMGSVTLPTTESTVWNFNQSSGLGSFRLINPGTAPAVYINATGGIQLNDNNRISFDTAGDYYIESPGDRLNIWGADEFYFKTFGKVDFEQADTYHDNLEISSIRFRGPTGVYDRNCGWRNSTSRFECNDDFFAPNFIGNFTGTFNGTIGAINTTDIWVDNIYPTTGNDVIVHAILNVTDGAIFDDIVIMRDNGQLYANFDPAGFTFNADSISYNSGDGLTPLVYMDDSGAFRLLNASMSYFEIPSGRPIYLDGTTHQKFIWYDATNDLVSVANHTRIYGNLTSDNVIADASILNYVELVPSVFVVAPTNPTFWYDSLGSYFRFNDNVFFEDNVTADYYFGDGSQLTGITTEGFWNRTGTQIYPAYVGDDVNMTGDVYHGNNAVFWDGNPPYTVMNITDLGTPTTWSLEARNQELHLVYDNDFVITSKIYSPEYDITRWGDSEMILKGAFLVRDDPIGGAGSGYIDLRNDMPIKFDNTNTKTLLWDSTDQRFKFNDDVEITNNLLLDTGYALLDSDQSVYLNSETEGTPIESNQDAWTTNTTIWTGTGLTNNTVDFIQGDSSIQKSGVGVQQDRFDFDNQINVTGYDTFTFWGKRVSKNTNIAWFRFYSNSTDYYEVTGSGGFTTEWEPYVLDLTGASATGSPSWENLTHVIFQHTMTTPSTIIRLDKFYFGGGIGIKWDSTNNQVVINNNLDVEDRLSIHSDKLFTMDDNQLQWLRWSSLNDWFEFNGPLRIDGDVNTSGSYYGDGSQLTGISATSFWNRTGTTISPAFTGDTVDTDSGDLICGGELTVDGGLFSMSGGAVDVSVSPDNPRDSAWNFNADVYLANKKWLLLEGETGIYFNSTDGANGTASCKYQDSSQRIICSPNLAATGKIRGAELQSNSNVTAGGFFIGDGSLLTGISAGAGSLADLNDTTITSPLNGNILIYNGSTWNNLPGGRAEYFDAYDNVGGTSVGTSWTDVSLTAERQETSAFNHTGTSPNVTIQTNGTYTLVARASLDITVGTTRDVFELRLTRDTGTGPVEIDGSSAYGYIRNTATGEGTANTQVILDLNEGDIIKMQVIRIDGTSTASTLADGSGLTIFNNVVGNGGGGGGTTDHAALSNLDWANAGHTIAGNTVVDFNNGGTAKYIVYNTTTAHFDSNAEWNPQSLFVGNATGNMTIGENGLMKLAGNARHKKLMQYYPYNIGGLTGTFNGTTCAAGAGLASLNAHYFKSYDQTIVECAHMAFTLPDDYVMASNITVKAGWVAGATTGNVVWRTCLYPVVDADSYSTPSIESCANLTVPVSGSLWRRQTLEFEIPLALSKDNADMAVVMMRVGSDSEDTLAADAYTATTDVYYISDSIGNDL